MIRDKYSTNNSSITNNKIYDSISYPPYPGNVLTKQHSVAYWLTLDLLSAAQHDATRAKWERAAVRVVDPDDADVFFVPYFASLSYEKDGRGIKTEHMWVKPSRMYLLQPFAVIDFDVY